MALDGVVQRLGGGMVGRGEKEEEDGITIMAAADPVDIGIFVGLQFFASNGNGGGGETCIIAGLSFLFVIF